ncbi:hypothetical protein [Methylibium sp.]|uniref:hypothetical protein n=1 Tax=Methylibium sp. TaxID=2067992 RepID=UPI001849566A|nr:hypothetical protein [Methylibium sp.]MBA3591812.1 hypothetical protein [Methylibium sp.]
MIVEWLIVVAIYMPDGSAKTTSRRGFDSQKACEAALRLDMESTFKGLPAVKGHCVDFPVRPAGLPTQQPAPKKGAVNA